jgi:hypothetical protein
VIVTSDPEEYEICFVGEEGFFDLCTTKPGDDLVDYNLRE